MRWVGVVVVVGAVLGAAPAEAKLEKDVPQEVFLGDMVYTQDQLELQLFTRWRLDRHDARNDYRATLGAEFGLTDTLELDASLPVESQLQAGERDTGLGNIEVGALWMATQHKPSGPDLSFGLSVQLPTAADEADRSLETELEVIAHSQVAGPLHAQLMLSGGVAHASQDSSTSAIGGAVGSLYLPLHGLIPILQGEVRREDESWRYAVAPGAIWHPGGDFELGLSVPIRFEEQTSVGGLLTFVYELQLGGDQG